MYTIGIDLGGTFIKGGICDDLGNIIVSDKVPTETEFGADRVMDNISTLAFKLLEKAGLSVSDVEGLGMGVPGMIDSKNGTVILRPASNDNLSARSITCCNNEKERVKCMDR